MLRINQFEIHLPNNEKINFKVTIQHIKYYVLMNKTFTSFIDSIKNNTNESP